MHCTKSIAVAHTLAKLHGTQLYDAIRAARVTSSRLRITENVECCQHQLYVERCQTGYWMNYGKPEGKIQMQHDASQKHSHCGYASIFPLNHAKTDGVHLYNADLFGMPALSARQAIG